MIAIGNYYRDIEFKSTDIKHFYLTYRNGYIMISRRLFYLIFFLTLTIIFSNLAKKNHQLEY